jgi:hypothetical protein
VINIKPTASGVKTAQSHKILLDNGGWAGKDRVIEGANLMKVPYIHVQNATTKPL